MSTSLHIFGGKTVVILLILTLISVNVGTIVMVDSNNRTSDHIQENSNRNAARIEEEILNHTRSVDVHVNQTNESLQILLTNKELQEPFLNAFEKHINGSATSPVQQENNRILKEILAEIKPTPSSDNLTSSNSTNNTGSG